MKKMFLLLFALNGFFLQPLNAVILEATTKLTNKFLFSNGKTLSLPKNLQINLLNNPEAVEILNAKNITISCNEISKKFKSTKIIQAIINQKYINIKISSKFSEKINEDSIIISPYSKGDQNYIDCNFNLNNLSLLEIEFSNAQDLSPKLIFEEVDESVEEDMTVKDRMSISRMILFENEDSEQN